MMLRLFIGLFSRSRDSKRSRRKTYHTGAAENAELYNYKAAEQGHAAVAEALLRLGVDPDVTDGWIATALMGATEHGHTDAVAALLRGGAAVDAVGEDGETALMWAATKGRAECARLLLEAGAGTALRGTIKPWKSKTAL